MTIDRVIKKIEVEEDALDQEDNVSIDALNDEEDPDYYDEEIDDPDDDEDFNRRWYGE